MTWMSAGYLKFTMHDTEHLLPRTPQTYRKKEGRRKRGRKGKREKCLPVAQVKDPRVDFDNLLPLTPSPRQIPCVGPLDNTEIFDV